MVGTMLRPSRVRLPVLVAIIAIIAIIAIAGCSSSSPERTEGSPQPTVTTSPGTTSPDTSSPDTTTPETTTPDNTTPDTTTPEAASAPTTESPTTEPPPTSESSPTTEQTATAPWSDTAATEYAAVLATLANGSGGDAQDVLDRLFGNPLPVELPEDRALAGAYVHGDRTADGFDVSWDLSIDAASDPGALEAHLAEFEDPRFEIGVRVESTLDSGVFVTLNLPATASGAADGWRTASFTVGPETGVIDPDHPIELELQGERVFAEDPELPAFLDGWLDELPIADGLQLETLSAQLVRLSQDTIDMRATFSGDPDAFADIVEFYAQDHTAGALVLDAEPAPDDLATIDRFNAGFFPTLAGFSIGIVVTRDLGDPAAPVIVEMYVTLAPPSS
jgi:hypothetical protein